MNWENGSDSTAGPTSQGWTGQTTWASLPSSARAGLLGTLLCGGLHALGSLYWSMGGTFMLNTIGQAAVRWQRESPAQVALVVLPIGLVKASAVAIPFLVFLGRLPGRRWWRPLFWVGASGISVYGLYYLAQSVLALRGFFGPLPDRLSIQGHAYFWEPLFVLWGLSLLVALRATRGGRESDGHVR